MTLSVCLIVKDEEKTLARCLSCAQKFADEIIVADTGSRDSTKEIAESFTDKVYPYEWEDDFSAARNFSFSKATCDLVMWLDADDVIDDANAQKIAELKERDDFDIAYLKYVAATDGNNPTFVYYRERIFRRAVSPVWVGKVHEVATASGRTIYSDAEIVHAKVKQNSAARNLRIYQNCIIRGQKLTPRERFYYGRELFFNGMYPECAAVLSEYLESDGWVENKIEACRTLYKAYWCMGKRGEAIAALLRSFAISIPRAETCCYLADYFEHTGDIPSAIYWYKLALSSEESAESGGFLSVDHLRFIPAMRLCVLYDKLGEYDVAESYNELAGVAKPDNECYLYNKMYFNNKKTER